MPRLGIIFAILGFIAVLIAALAIYFALNISRIGLLESGVLVGVAVVALLVIIGVLVAIIKVAGRK